MLSKVLPGLVCLASLGQAVRAQDAPITDDSFFYGQSEPVFPTRMSFVSSRMGTFTTDFPTQRR